MFTASQQTAAARDVMMANLGPPVEIVPLIKTSFAEFGPRISPDGRWIAYASNESGRNEVYVRPFPDVDQGRWQVSTDGGVDPRWAKNGRELFFAKGGFGTPRTIWSTQVQTGLTFVTGTPTEIAKSASAASVEYDVAPDGRVLVHVDASGGAGRGAARPHLVVVQNWFDELKARVPTTPRQD